ncbi:Hypothetical protein A7982_05581 [Minicystis rosea]|nr:Hypothetical protein A7982_05581 [Minicystis rosea]
MSEAEPSNPTSSPHIAGAPRLLDAFRELYAEVVRSARALSGPEPPQHEAVKQRLLNVLARQGAEAKERLGEHELAELDEAHYVMVAMADEVFLHIDWPGRDPWSRRPLEAESRFGTHIAGERVFDRLEEIFKNRISVSADLLNVYLAALSLGFRGRYRFDPQSTEPERFRRDLVREIRRVDPRSAAPAAELCPDATHGVRDKEPRRGLTNLREGILPLLGVLLGMLLLGHALWYYRTSDVRDKLDQIEAQRKVATEVREKSERAQREAKEAAAKASAESSAAPPDKNERPPEPQPSDGGTP